MGTADYIILIAVAIGLFAAVFFSIRRRRRGGGCCGDCFNCHSGCHNSKNKK
ncbi:MAG: FeoB-associated Cys-rich membrane protein [Eubacteriales bacterium]|nr:FeoB-associated Cys-rich membrane protein [Eubacteriales bacterium]MDY4897605.1 FeoB-associated Cys-rich membrane protein [Eubacteriales bacterium]